MALPPLQLRPVLAHKPWGGRRLGAFGRELPPDARIGESWDVTDVTATSTVEDAVSRVAAGPLAGVTLRELLARDREGLLGDAAPVDGRFPLLVKTLDAREHLSVQVHPPSAYVAEDPTVHAKAESWVVLEADPGSELLLGFLDGVTPTDVAAAIGTPAVTELLRRVPARAGDVHHLPAGLVHALGAGTVVVEVESPSDTTFRLYDWTEEYDRPVRDLHPTEALRAIELGWAHNVADPRPRGAASGRVVATEAHVIDRHELADGDPVPTPTGRVSVLYVLAGAVTGPSLALPTTVGSVVVLPASCDEVLRASGATTVLVATPA